MDNSRNQLVDMLKIDKLLKGNEVAKLLNISRSRAYIRMQTGIIATVGIGKSRRRTASGAQSIHQTSHLLFQG
jgi:hypothetical protein